MKKILLFSLLITSLYSDAKIYMGLGGGYLHESFSDAAGTTSSAEMARIKVGYGDREAYAVEFSLDMLKNDTNIFSTSGDDGDKFGMNIELIKAFDFDMMINPYFKTGFGAGYFDVNSPSQSSLHYGSFNLGLGFFIPINEHFDVEVGYDYKYVSYEKQTDATGAKLKEIDSNMNGVYIGFNVRF